MATEIKLWEIIDGKLIPSETSMIETGRKEFEHLEKWIKSDPKILGENILIIGEQVQTRKGPLDFLGIDDEGNIIIIELKRDKLPRDALAQAIDYASDIFSWNIERLSEECTKYTGQSLEDYLKERFEDVDWGDMSINQLQKILLVGTETEESLQRMVEWLSDNYDMGVNVVIFKYTKTKSGDELLARTMIISEEIEKEKSQRHKRKILYKDYSLDYHLSNKPDFIKDLVNKLRETILDFNEQISEKFKKHYISYSLKKNFTEIIVQSNGLWIHIDARKENLSDPENRLIDVSDKGHWATGNLKIRVENQEGIEYAMKIIKQSYEGVL